MRILHTSDWHLGQNFYERQRHSEHKAFLDWLLLQVDTLAVDAIIVAGDVFDTTAPPSYARELYNQFVVSLHSRSCQLIVVAGNHDSTAMLNESKSLLACLNVHVAANADVDDSLVIVTDKLGIPSVLVCAIPFLRSRELLRSLEGEQFSERDNRLAEAIRRYYHASYRKAVAWNEAHQQSLPIIATGHLTALGASVAASSSVREIYIGNLEAFDANLFPPADYIALGHIHRPQLVAKKSHIRYCGSPIPLSFDELKTQKEVILLTFSTNESTPVITPMAVPCFQKIMTLSGSMDELRRAIQLLETESKPVWLSIEVTSTDAHHYDLQSQIESLTQDLPVVVLQVRRKITTPTGLSIETNESLNELSASDVFSRRLNHDVDSGGCSVEMATRLSQHFQTLLTKLETTHS
jgi:exonuclease SbcD